MLPRSKKYISVLVSTAAFLFGLGLMAGPASAFSLNPDAGSPGISDSNTLHIILFIVLLVGIVGVNLAILRAARPRHRHIKPVESARTNFTKQLRVGLGLGVVAVAIFVTAVVFSDKSNNVPPSTAQVAGTNADGQLDIVATGQQWIWRFNYPSGTFTYRRLVVPVGVTVALHLKSSDVIHGWNVPDLTGKADAVPGKTTTIYFRADKEGTYGGEAAILSGQGYNTMTSQVDALAPEDYTAYLVEQKKNVIAAQNSVEKNFTKVEDTP